MQSYCFAFSLHNMRFLYEPSEGNAAFCARRETRGSLLHSRFYVSSRNAPKNGCVADYPSSRAPRSAKCRVRLAWLIKLLSCTQTILLDRPTAFLTFLVAIAVVVPEAFYCHYWQNKISVTP